MLNKIASRVFQTTACKEAGNFSSMRGLSFANPPFNRDSLHGFAIILTIEKERTDINKIDINNLKGVRWISASAIVIVGAYRM